MGRLWNCHLWIQSLNEGAVCANECDNSTSFSYAWNSVWRTAIVSSGFVGLKVLLQKSCLLLLMGSSYCAGPAFFNIPNREQEYSGYHEGSEDTSRKKQVSSICEENFRLPSASRIGAVSGHQCWYPSIDWVCAHTNPGTRRIPALDRIHGKCCCLMFLWLIFAKLPACMGPAIQWCRMLMCTQINCSLWMTDLSWFQKSSALDVETPERPMLYTLNRWQYCRFSLIFLFLLFVPLYLWAMLDSRWSLWQGGVFTNNGRLGGPVKGSTQCCETREKDLEYHVIMW